MHRNLRQVIESKRFSRERDRLLTDDIRRWDEIFRGIEWALCQAPERVGKETSAPGIRAVPVAQPPGQIDLVVYYTFNDEQVTLLSIRQAEPGGEN
jgi:hypothetical protein